MTGIEQAPRRTLAALATAIVITLIIVVSIAVAAPPTSQTERATPSAASPVANGATPVATEVLTAADFAIISNAITLRLTASGFMPQAFQYAVGHEVDATLVNTDDQEHTFTIDELDIDIAIPAGETRLVTIPPAAYGDYTYHSTAPGDRGPEWEGLMRVFL
ncbi:MAG: cupredoxin domain-containing protein [Chloroflexi bacterium]|nr:cupredoxin domain-containing protein [Chloroflexota bacterium]